MLDYLNRYIGHDISQLGCSNEFVISQIEIIAGGSGFEYPA
jgi:hypothetical protein